MHLIYAILHLTNDILHLIYAQLICTILQATSLQLAVSQARLPANSSFVVNAVPGAANAFATINKRMVTNTATPTSSKIFFNP